MYIWLMKYNWQLPDWPHFSYDSNEIEDVLFAFAEETGHVSGIIKTLPEHLKLDTVVDLMVAEAIKTSEIEGEHFSRIDVMSSIRNGLGLNKKPVPVKSKMAQGVGKLMVEVRATYAEPLTRETIWGWHELLMADSRNIQAGKWRSHKDPMQVVSGSLGKEKVQFEAAPSSQVAKEMTAFVHWFNDTAPGGKKEIKKGPVRSAIAHLYFESIHPFEDGNGRIGRAIAEKALAQTLGRPLLLSLSRTIEADKKKYYAALKEASLSNDVTKWVKYFSGVLLAAQRHTQQTVDQVLRTTRFFDKYSTLLNERQIKVVKKMTGDGVEPFEGGMNATKYMSITKVSKATATRDLQYLAEIGAITVTGGGRSTSYTLNLDA